MIPANAIAPKRIHRSTKSAARREINTRTPNCNATTWRLNHTRHGIQAWSGVASREREGRAPPRAAGGAAQSRGVLGA